MIPFVLVVLALVGLAGMFFLSLRLARVADFRLEIIERSAAAAEEDIRAGCEGNEWKRRWEPYESSSFEDMLFSFSALRADVWYPNATWLHDKV